MPFVVWSRLRADLSPYLMERAADGCVLLDFFHRQIGELIEGRYLTELDLRRAHEVLANVFRAQDNFLDPDVRGIPNARKLTEQAYQELHARRWEQLECTLTDFDWLMAKCMSGQQDQMASDYRDAWMALSAAGLHRLREWAAMVRENAHLLRRGGQSWSAHKIFLQLATEHADESPVTCAAETWLRAGQCDRCQVRTHCSRLRV